MRTIGATLAIVLATIALAQTGRPRPTAPPPAARAASLPATNPSSTTQAATPEDEAHALLAGAERRRGATFIGKDPAFLVLPRPAERNDMGELLTPKVAEMTEKALGFLGRSQNADGSWSDTQFAANTGVSALACLAFMAEGSSPKIGRYGKQLDLGLEFIMKNVEASGIIAGKGSNPPGPMYEHAFSMLAVLYAYGDMPHRPQTRDVLAKGLGAILRSQHLDGGWRYALSNEGDSDLSVSANVLWVLRTAKKSGFSVPAATIEKGMKYVENCAMPDGTFRYRVWGLHGEANLGGAGMIALCNQGRLDHPLIAPARDRIAYEYRRYSAEDLAARRYSAYGCFYASVALYACGDAYFRPWFAKASAVLEKLQRKDGELTDEGGNTVYPTAMGALVLQAPRGYLPLYER